MAFPEIHKQGARVKTTLEDQDFPAYCVLITDWGCRPWEGVEGSYAILLQIASFIAYFVWSAIFSSYATDMIC